jgi:hypothetical protein
VSLTDLPLYRLPPVPHRHVSQTFYCESFVEIARLSQVRP